MAGNTDINSEMKNLANYAIRVTQEKFNRTLDFSENSLSQLELLLEQAYQSFKQQAIENGINERAFERTITIWGGYLGEIIRQKFGGTWIRKGKDAVLVVQGIEISPVQYTKTRLTTSPTYGVWQYYNEVKIQVTSPNQSKNKKVRKSGSKLPVVIAISIVLLVGCGLLSVVGYFVSKPYLLSYFSPTSTSLPTRTPRPKPTNTKVFPPTYTSTPRPTSTRYPTSTNKPTLAPTEDYSILAKSYIPELAGFYVYDSKSESNGTGYLVAYVRTSPKAGEVNAVMYNVVVSRDEKTADSNYLIIYQNLADNYETLPIDVRENYPSVDKVDTFIDYADTTTMGQLTLFRKGRVICTVAVYLSIGTDKAESLAKMVYGSSSYYVPAILQNLP